MTEAVQLDALSVEAIARRVVELLREESAPTGALLSPQQLADRLGVGRAFVYQHAVELGARRLGDGPKGRLRFDPEQAQAAMLCLAGRESKRPATSTVEPKRRRRRPASLGTSSPLLPIRGSQ